MDGASLRGHANEAQGEALSVKHMAVVLILQQGIVVNSRSYGVDVGHVCKVWLGGDLERTLELGDGRRTRRAKVDVKRAEGIRMRGGHGILRVNVGQPHLLLVGNTAVVFGGVGVVRNHCRRGDDRGGERGNCCRGRLPFGGEQRAEGVDIAFGHGYPQRHGRPAVLFGETSTTKAGGGDLHFDRVGGKGLGGTIFGSAEVLVGGRSVSELLQIESQGGLVKGMACVAIKLPDSHTGVGGDGDETGAQMAQGMPQCRNDGGLLEHVGSRTKLERLDSERASSIVA